MSTVDHQVVKDGQLHTVDGISRHTWSHPIEEVGSSGGQLQSPIRKKKLYIYSPV